ncbi:Threonine/homoserine/homoserine lactone efflux protein [Micromonospora echinaurantiaca]|uniref:Threonine/homoserine/homoserine lactone efflux protein n=2 Tax=Micromonospora echinaurantiaca TaxID=47857 RepID=A0A1C5IFZ3_9ACTN|nr:Threonine/homoserine/homoserine lactone efflux protein [Micromonospora echinaurantiaca]
MLGVPMEAYGAFLAASFVIAVVPGADHVYLGAVALRNGRRAGVVAASGMAVSMTVHTLVAVTGVGAVVVALPAALVTIRLVGAGYLVYLGMGALRRADGPDAPPVTATGRNFWRAMVVNLTNPKIVIFFIAFLPQFVDTTIGHSAVQLLVLGLSFVVVGFLIDTVYALLGGLVGRLLARRGKNARALAMISGIVYLVLGALVLASLLIDLLAVRPEPF